MKFIKKLIEFFKRLFRLKSSKKSQETEYTVVLRGPSSVVFHKNEEFLIKDFHYKKNVTVDIKIRSRWISSTNQIEIPGHLWVEVKGKSKLDFQDVLTAFSNAGISFLPALSFCANAAIKQIELELGFDSTPNSDSREYFQNYLPQERHEVHSFRHIDIGSTRILIDKVARHSDSSRLLRAMAQYRLALDHWRTGLDTMCLAHLWMAVEALTKAKIRKEITTRGLNSQRELANDLNINIRELDGFIRKEMLLNGDQECYRKAKEASDGFEHGYLDFREISELATTTRSKMAKYVREAIFDIIDLEQDVTKILTEKPYDEPVGYWPFARYLKGKLINAENRVAKEGEPYPYMEWKPSIKEFELGENHIFNMKLNENFTAHLADGVKFKPQKVEIWKHK